MGVLDQLSGTFRPAVETLGNIAASDHLESTIWRWMLLGLNDFMTTVQEMLVKAQNNF